MLWCRVLPGPVAHDFIDRLYFGKSYPKIHRAMDKPAKYFGRGHRVLFHDETWAYAIASRYYPNDFNAVIAAQFHLIFDDLCSKDPEYKKYLEKLAEISKKKRKKKKKPKMVSVKIRI